MMEMAVLHQAEDYSRISLSGRLDANGVGEVEERLLACAGYGKNIIIDAAKLVFLSSMGIRVLLALAKKLAAAGAKLVLAAPPEKRGDDYPLSRCLRDCPGCSGFSEGGGNYRWKA